MFALAGTIVGALLSMFGSIAVSLVTAWNARRIQQLQIDRDQQKQDQDHRHDGRKQKQEHEHDEKKRAMQIDYEKQRDQAARLMQLRRDVFFPAIEVIGQAQITMGLAVDPSLPTSEVTRAMSDVAAKMAPVQLAGSDDTARMCLRFGSALGIFVHEVTALRNATLQDRAALADPRATAMHFAQHNAAYFNAVRGVLDRNMPKLQAAQADAILAMRAELGLDTDAAVYRETQRSLLADLMASFDRLQRSTVGT